ncbi:helix-turn-helix domain-containing protein [Galbibacter mesophilus]|uniref:helix-turn-helix domain-containing protein n=1 Tax=Galbibacter mesophilus TaxID=379069 RepID=UPI00191CECAF|nr:AraC family transcriptional regulator [Galbibacter mesophilus]MCM5661415.1 AraC family transcriptional regulator [Galbibacter mesophilus]
MDKKRRDFINCEVINLAKLKCDFKEVIAISKQKNEAFGILNTEYQLKNNYGEGCISLIEFQGVSIHYCNFKLTRDLVFYAESNEPSIQMSFLIEGEKIISLRGYEDVLNESQEGYLVKSEDFKGYVRVTGQRIFKEIRISIAIDYLKNKGLKDLNSVKNYNDSGIIQPFYKNIHSLIIFILETNFQNISGRLLLESKILELLSLQLEQSKTQRQVNAAGNNKILKKIYEAKEFMEANLNENYSIKEMSKTMALNEYIFKKEFKRIFGCTINEFYMQQKMNKASELLRASQKPIYEIAEAVGYKNATHFSAAFKRVYKLSPKQFRNRLFESEAIGNS